MSSLVDRLRRWLSSPHATAAIVLVAVLVGLPSLGGGLVIDDHWHRITLASHDASWSVLAKPWYELFTFSDGDPARTRRIVDLGLFTWWTDPRLTLAFFRPVAAATHLLDYALWPSHPWIMHAHSVAWFAALVAVAAWVYRRLCPGWTGGLAGLLFALDHTHGIPIAWLANRNALVAGVFALAALGAHDVAARGEGGSPPRRAALWSIGSAALFAVALGSGEGATALAGYFAAHLLFLDARAWRTKLASLAPHALVGALWAVLYRAGGFGARGSGMYTEPAREPLQFLAAVAKHLPMLAASELGAPPPDLYAFLPLGVKIGFVAFALLFLLWAATAIARAWRADPVARFFVVGSALAIVPACATLVSSRLLVVPGFGLIGLVALLGAGVADGAAWVPRDGASRRLVRAYVLWASAGHLLLSPLALQVTMQQLPRLERVLERFAVDLPTAPSPTLKRIVLLNAVDAIFVPYIFLAHSAGNGEGATRMPARILTMATGVRVVELVRTDDHTMVVRVDGGFYRSGTELVTRNLDVPMPVGSRVELTDVTIEVLATGPDGVPTEASFRFAESLDAEAYLWERWEGTRLVGVRPPAVGEHVTIPPQIPKLF